MSLTHTGLTEKVFQYQAPDPPVPEREPPKDRAFFADSTKSDLLSAASRVRNVT
jgi:sulfonate dioxygenase